MGPASDRIASNCIDLRRPGSSTVRVCAGTQCRTQQRWCSPVAVACAWPSPLVIGSVRVDTPHVVRRRSSLEQLRRNLYLAQRTIGDVQALQRGTLPKRLVRRSLVRSLLRGVR